MSIIHQTDKLVGLPPDRVLAIRADAHVPHLEAHLCWLYTLLVNKYVET